MANTTAFDLLTAFCSPIVRGDSSVPSRASAREETGSPAHAGVNADLVRVLLVSDQEATRCKLANRLRDAGQNDYELRFAKSLDDLPAAMADEVDVAFVDLDDSPLHVRAGQAAEDGGVPIVAVGTQGRQAAIAYDRGAADFVLLDATAPRLSQAVARATNASSGLLVGAAPGLGQHRLNGRPRQVRASRGGELIVASLDSVLYFQAERKLTCVVLPGESAHLHQGINTVAEGLDAGQFWRIHRGTVINSHLLQSARRDDQGRLSVTLRGCNRPLAVSRPYEQSLLQEGIF